MSVDSNSLVPPKGNALRDWPVPPTRLSEYLQAHRRPHVLIVKVPLENILTCDIYVNRDDDRSLPVLVRDEIDRVTPFAAHEICWATARGHRIEFRGDRRVRLHYFPWSLIKELAVPAARKEWRSVLIILGENIASVRYQPAPEPDSRCLSLIALVLVMCSVFSGIDMLSRVAAIHRLSSLTRQLSWYDEAYIQHENFLLSQQRGFAAAARQDAKTERMLRTISLLETALPGSFLERLSIRLPEVSLTGYSEDPQKIFRNLAEYPLLQNVFFLESRMPSGVQKFQISATYGG